MQLKYGCNPHQAYACAEPLDKNNAPLEVLHGTPSFINLLDALNAWQLVAEVRLALGRQPPPASNTCPQPGPP